MPTRLTIITPSFNQAAFLEKTLRSVLDQDWPDLEYFVVDGGSTDGSVDIIRRYEDRLAWWVSEPDRGQTDALNKALRRATGDVVAYVNSDDYYLPGAFATAMAALDESLWVVGASRFVDADGAVTETWWPQQPWGGRHQWLLAPWGAPQPSTFWRREAFDRYGHFREDMHYVFDTEFNLRLALAGHLPKLVQEELAVRVVHEEAKSWDRAPFIAEQKRFFELFRDQLTPRERAMYRGASALERLGFYRAMGTASKRWRAAGLPALRKG